MKKTLREKLCPKCLKIFREYEAEKQREWRKVNIKKVGTPIKGKIKIIKK